MAKQASFWQITQTFEPKSRGFHLITDEILACMQSMPDFETGLVHLFIQHTSASLCISENTCHEVRDDLESYYTNTVPDDSSLYTHTLEGDDDMPAHIKNTLLGSSLTLPLVKGRLGLGQWQGIYLCEHRNQAPRRHLVMTVQAQ